jgi:hypothetical protein
MTKSGLKTTLRFVLMAGVLSLPLGAGAVMWTAVISNEKMRADIDLASLLRQGNIVTAWDRETYVFQEQARPGDFYFKSAKSLMRYNCDFRTADLLMRVYYADDGSEIKTITASYYGRPNYVIPDTEAEQKFDYACRYKKTVEKKAVAVAKKGAKEKEADKADKPEAKKEAPAAKEPAAKAKPATPETPPKAFPETRTRPAFKPLGTLPPANAEKKK